MAAPMTAGIPFGLNLGGNYVLQFTALDPTTGAAVTSVRVSSATMTVTPKSAGQIGGVVEPTEIPWLNLPVEG